MDAKKKVVKPKVKKPVKKGKKAKPKKQIKQKQTQIQKQTQKVIVNLGEVKKRTRRVATSKKKPPLTAFSGSAQSPLLINPFDNVYRDLIQPVREQQRQFQQQQVESMQRRQNELDDLRTDFRRGFVGINQRLSQLQPTGDVTQQVAQEKADLQRDAFEESRRMDAEQPEGTAVARLDPFESSSEPPAPAPAPAPASISEAKVLKKIPKTQIGERIQARIDKYQQENNSLPERQTVLNYANSTEFKSLQINRDDIRNYIERSGQYPKKKGGRKKKKN
jgi:hypothetical protein